MKILQLNTWSCGLPLEIIRLLDTERPDFITMQEVVSTQFDSKILTTIDDILNTYPFADSYYAPLIEFAFMHHRASRGNLIASQLPIVTKHEIWTHGEYTEDFDREDSGGYNAARNIIHTQYSVNGKPLHILTLHGYHLEEHKLGNEQTMAGCKKLKDFADSLEGAVIITGDFNLAPESESMRYLSHYYRNLSVENNLTTTRNRLTKKTETCDYILVNDAVNVQKFYMSDILASDHNALVLEFDLKP